MDKCPKCKAVLDDSLEFDFVGLIDSANDPDGKARADIIARCAGCGSQWNAFVSLGRFFVNPIHGIDEEVA